MSNTSKQRLEITTPGMMRAGMFLHLQCKIQFVFTFGIICSRIINGTSCGSHAFVSWKHLHLTSMLPCLNGSCLKYRGGKEGCSILQKCYCHNSTEIAAPVLLGRPHERRFYIKNMKHDPLLDSLGCEGKEARKCLDDIGTFPFFHKAHGATYNLNKPQITPTMHFTEYNVTISNARVRQLADAFKLFFLCFFFCCNGKRQRKLENRC